MSPVTSNPGIEARLVLPARAALAPIPIPMAMQQMPMMVRVMLLDIGGAP
jgi:hypothetical protein